MLLTTQNTTALAAICVAFGFLVVSTFATHSACHRIIERTVTDNPLASVSRSYLSTESRARPVALSLHKAAPFDSNRDRPPPGLCRLAPSTIWAVRPSGPRRACHQRHRRLPPNPSYRHRLHEERLVSHHDWCEAKAIYVHFY